MRSLTPLIGRVACVFLVGLSGCTELSVEPEPEPATPLEEFELHEWCEEAPAQPFESIGEQGVFHLGPCGHLIVEQFMTSILIHPDGTRSDLDDIAWPLTQVEFGPTGTVVSWASVAAIESGGQALHELYGERERIIEGPFERKGFVHSSTTDIGSWMWTCGDELELHDFDSDASYDAAICPSVLAATQAPRLVFARPSGALISLDPDTGVELELDTLVQMNELRVDELDLDHSGRVVLHRKQLVGQSGLIVPKETKIFAGGEHMVTLDEPASLLQGASINAAVFVRTASELSVLDRNSEGVEYRSVFGADLLHLAIARDEGSVAASTVDGNVYLARSEAPTEILEIATLDSQASSLFVAPGGQWVSWAHYAGGCVSADCNYLLAHVDRWSAETGLLEPLLVTGLPTVTALFDDGSILLRTTIYTGEGLANNDPDFLLLGPDGEVVTELSPELGTEFVDPPLSDGRILLRRLSDQTGETALKLLDPSSGAQQQLGVAGHLVNMAIDGLGERVVVEHWDSDLIWGSAP